MKTHTTIGAHTLQKVIEQVNHPTFLMAYNLVRHHHERYDGSGYPDGLSGDNIPFESRIISIADVFDALMSKRCYKEAFNIDQTLQVIRKESGRRFDPELVAVMLDNIETFKTIHDRYADSN
jgi:HD-GYP domain-containing protein (c-di-GMP phosphodiesterase class II)